MTNPSQEKTLRDEFAMAEARYKSAGYKLSFIDFIEWCWDNERTGYLRYFVRQERMK